MSKQKALSFINAKIDRLIIDGKTQTAEYKRLIRLHYSLTH
jgi:hypothetical protein